MVGEKKKLYIVLRTVSLVEWSVCLITNQEIADSIPGTEILKTDCPPKDK